MNTRRETLAGYTCVWGVTPVRVRCSKAGEIPRELLQETLCVIVKYAFKDEVQENEKAAM
jgi:hypothetical protein